MKLIKTSLSTGFATVIKLVGNFIINKVTAVFVGTEGLSVLGNVSNLISVASSFGTAGINNGIVKYLSESEGKMQGIRYFIAGLTIVILSSALVGFALIFFAEVIANYLLLVKYIFFIKIFGVLVVVNSLGLYFLSVLNGLKKISLYTRVNVLTTITSLIVTITLIWLYQLDGAILGLILTQSFILIFVLQLIIRYSNIRYFTLSTRISRVHLKRLLNFGLTALVASLVIPIVQVQIRNMIIVQYGQSDAGIWQGMVRISDSYLMFITSALSVYLLPKFSSFKVRKEFTQEIRKSLPLILIVTVSLGLVVYYLRDYVILFLYSFEFMAMEELFLFHLIGDFLKIIGWFFSYLLLANAKTGWFILGEGIFGVVYLSLSSYFLSSYGIVGLSWSFCASYGIYSAYIIFVVNSLFNRLPNK